MRKRFCNLSLPYFVSKFFSSSKTGAVTALSANPFIENVKQMAERRHSDDIFGKPISKSLKNVT